jgi:hypothetical protein
MNELEPVETKICRACEKQKKITSYSRTSSGNRAGVCNMCRSLGNTIKNKNLSQKEPTKNTPLQLGNPSQKDYENAYRFLENIGYSLKEDLHIQFCKKYGLTPNSPKQTFLNHYSQKDLGLV